MSTKGARKSLCPLDHGRSTAHPSARTPTGLNSGVGLEKRYCKDERQELMVISEIEKNARENKDTNSADQGVPVCGLSNLRQEGER